MGMAVLGGAQMMCSFGLSPGVLNVLPANKVVSTMPVATIMDNNPFVNITPFGMCTCMGNPAVASATAAAFGVLTPCPCTPNVTAPWAPGSPTVLIGGSPALNNTSKLMCAFGGVIQILQPGTANIQVP